jgi:hypothetical protein
MFVEERVNELNVRARHWSVTCNLAEYFRVADVPEDLWDVSCAEIGADVFRQMDDRCTYAIFGYERGDATVDDDDMLIEGTPHLQCYFYCPSRCYGSYISGAFVALNLRPHVEHCGGSVEDNIRYCSKESNFFEFGLRPVGAADVSKKKRAKAIELVSNVGLQSAISSDPVLLMSCSFPILKEYSLLKIPLLKTEDCRFDWFFGPAGSGKSFRCEQIVKEEYNGVANYKFGGVSMFWCRWLDDCPCCWIDNVTLRSNLELVELLGIAGRAPFTIHVKGVMHLVHCNRLLVTCLNPPREAFRLMDPQNRVGHTLEELTRRITRCIRCFKHLGHWETELVDTDFEYFLPVD